MSLLFADGFDLYTSVAEALSAGWQAETGASVSTSMGKFNGGHLAGDRDDQGWIKSLPINLASGQTIIVQWYYKIDSATVLSDEILAILGSGNFQCGLRVNSSGSLSARDDADSTVSSSVTGVIGGETWHYIEFKALLNNGSGTITVNVDEVQVINVSSVDTFSATTTAVRFRGDDSSWLIDDVIIMDGNGTRLNGFIGETRISTLLPSGDTSQDNWSQSSSGATFQLLDEALGTSPSDTEYIESSTVGQETRVTMQDAPGNMTTVHAINSVYQSRKTDVTDVQLRGLINSNAVEELGNEAISNDQYSTTRTPHELDPGGGSPTIEWNKTSIDALEVGVEII